jgi:hypothetical protein
MLTHFTKLKTKQHHTIATFLAAPLATASGLGILTILTVSSCSIIFRARKDSTLVSFFRAPNLCASAFVAAVAEISGAVLAGGGPSGIADVRAGVGEPPTPALEAEPKKLASLKFM